MKGLAKLKDEEIREILKYISDATDSLHYENILSNMFKTLIEEQRNNLESLEKSPEKYRIIIRNTDRFMDILLEEMRGTNYEYGTNN